MRTRKLGWRWRRSPLRRRSDVVEAWAVLLVGTVLILGVPAAGFVAGAVVRSDARAEAGAEQRAPHQVGATHTA
ncbi:hypothetical protein ACFWX4_05310, partial [Streptomyces sp. NPDC059063]